METTPDKRRFWRSLPRSSISKLSLAVFFRIYFRNPRVCDRLVSAGEPTVLFGSRKACVLKGRSDKSARQNHSVKLGCR